MLLVLSAAAAAALPESEAQLERRLAVHSKTLQKSRSTVRFFRNHKWLLSDARFRARASREFSRNLRAVEVSTRRIAAVRVALDRLERTRQLAAVRRLTPQEAICDVFGRYCDQALQVARCESGLRTTARNGQYLGLFQMGSSERSLFGHGTSAEAQARAAWKYFTRSGRDWSPWSCKPW